MSKNYYSVLGVAPNAEPAVIKAAYKALSSIYHPDKNPNNIEETNRKMAEINEAWEVLSNTQKKAAYDEEFNNFQDTEYSDREHYDNTEVEDTFSKGGHALIFSVIILFILLLSLRLFTQNKTEANMQSSSTVKMQIPPVDKSEMVLSDNNGVCQSTQILSIGYFSMKENADSLTQRIKGLGYQIYNRRVTTRSNTEVWHVYSQSDSVQELLQIKEELISSFEWESSIACL